MKANIKRIILDTSRSLFNLHGYVSVSMRDISQSCGISVGNLTYHYPHKLDILCALMQEIQPQNCEDEITSLSSLLQYLREMILGLKKNAFFFSVSDMQRINEECFAINKESVQNLRNHLIASLQQLKENDILNENITPRIIEDIVSFWMLAQLSWANEDFQESTYKSNDLDDFLYQHLSLLLPYLTKKGKKQYDKLKK